MMMTKLTTTEQIKDLNSACKLLMENPHFHKLGASTIMTILTTAKSLGMDPMLALSGGLYSVGGKIEMSSRSMGALIRSKGHSIQQDKCSDDKVCILHGKRADTGDTACAKFTIEEAERAGLVVKGVAWKHYPSDMLYARALSRLARRLFPDVIGGCYVEGEVPFNGSRSPEILEQIEKTDGEILELTEVSEEFLSQEEIEGLEIALQETPDLAESIFEFYGSLAEIPKKDLAKLYKRINS